MKYTRGVIKRREFGGQVYTELHEIPAIVKRVSGKRY